MLRDELYADPSSTPSRDKSSERVAGRDRRGLTLSVHNAYYESTFENNYGECEIAFCMGFFLPIVFMESAARVHPRLALL